MHILFALWACAVIAIRCRYNAFWDIQFSRLAGVDIGSALVIVDWLFGAMALAPALLLLAWVFRDPRAVGRFMKWEG